MFLVNTLFEQNTIRTQEGRDSDEVKYIGKTTKMNTIKKLLIWDQAEMTYNQ